MTADLQEADVAINTAHFRSVLSHYPTGVCVITAMNDATPTGFVVGTFTSVSLDPPLVGFFADRGSTTFPKVRVAGAFCVNVLSAQDEDLCRVFSAKGVDRFAAVAWRPGHTGAPILEQATAWIDCMIDDIHTVGDHYLAIGRVVAMANHTEHKAAEPLIFHRGRFGHRPVKSRETGSR